VKSVLVTPVRREPPLTLEKIAENEGLNLSLSFRLFSFLFALKRVRCGAHQAPTSQQPTNLFASTSWAEQ
jgi:hypothetical protein